MPTPPPTPPSGPSPNSAEDSQRVRTLLDGALRRWQEALSAVLVDRIRGPLSVRNVADRLDIGRGTAHNLVRLLQADTLPGIVASMPGRSTRETVLVKCRLAEGSPDLVDVLDAAQSTLEGTLLRHAPTTAGLLAIVCGDAADDDLRRRLLRAFRSRFEIDQLMTGGCAETLIAAQMAAPSRDEVHADVGAIQIIDGLRGLRPHCQFEIYRPFEASTDAVSASEELQPQFCKGLDGLEIATSVSDKGFPSLLIDSGEGLPPGARLAFLQHSNACGPMDSSFEDDFAEQACPILLPIRHLRYELWLHRDVRRGSDPTSHLYYSADTSIGDFHRHMRSRVPMPADLTLIEAPFEADELDADLARCHESMIRLSVERMGRPLDEFECFRVSLPCPPMGSRIGIRWLLHHVPEADQTPESA